MKEKEIEENPEMRENKIFTAVYNDVCSLCPLRVPILVGYNRDGTPNMTVTNLYVKSGIPIVDDCGQLGLAKQIDALEVVKGITLVLQQKG